MLEDFMNSGTRERRARCLLAFVLAMFGILGVRLYSLQIGDWERYRIQSEKNTMQPVPLEASRGLILDRNGVILVDNRPSYTISVIPPRFLQGLENADREAGIRRLGTIVELPEATIRKKLAKRKRHFFEPVKLKRDVKFGAVSLVEEERYDLTGVEIQVEARRGYPEFNDQGTIAAHLLGYVGLIDPDEYPRLAPRGYGYDDQIGKRGVERLTEWMLRGRDGLKYIEVNAHGREVGSFPDKTQPPQPGQDVILTIDSRLQYIAESVFQDSLSGSLIAIDPNSGELLAIVSKPDFHPRAIRDPDAWERLKSGKLKPLLNRSIQGEYAPASVFKMITGIAALDMEILQPGEIKFPPCVGEIEFGDRIFRCHVTRGCGALDLRGALRQSCDSFFYHLGLEVGIANWHRYARLFGIGQATGIDIAEGGDGESRGLLPDRGYYVKHKGKYFDGNMLNLAIGQGETLATPIQIARYNAALASGLLVTPHILKNGNQPHPKEPVRIPEETLSLIREMLVDVVHYGTGKRGRIAGIDVAGKTGTAQNPHGEDHAWFISFAPAKNPEIAIVVIVENGGQGGSVAAPMARKVMERFFEIRTQDEMNAAEIATALEEEETAIADREPLLE
jgi:penicillin-binding protein 2